MENDIVVMKGEAVTKRGAFVRWPCIVTIRPKCLIHKFENIYTPRDSIKEAHKELLDVMQRRGKGLAGREQILFFDSSTILHNFLAAISLPVALFIS